MVVPLGTNNLHAVDHLEWAIIGHNKCDGKAAIHGRTGHFYPNAGVIPFMRGCQMADIEPALNLVSDRQVVPPPLLPTPLNMVQ